MVDEKPFPSRAQEYMAAGVDAPLPEITAGGYLKCALLELGVAQGGMGLSPIPWAEIQAYSEATGDITEPWEKRTLRAMSKAYVEWRGLGRNANHPAPGQRNVSQ